MAQCNKEEKKQWYVRNVPRGTCHMPPLPMLKEVSATLTCTRPEKTQKTMWFFREFFVFFSPPGGISTIPEWKKGKVMVLAYMNLAPLTSRLRPSSATGASAKSVALVSLGSDITNYKL